MTGMDKSSAFPRSVPRTDIDPDLVLAAVDRLSARYCSTPLTITVQDPTEPDPVIVVAEHERSSTIRLARLTQTFERDGVSPDDADIAAAVERWIDHRPVTDRVADAKGIATLGWSQRQSRISWRVVVPRPSGLAIDWIPTVRTPAREMQKVREKALERARALTVTPLPTGEVTVWVCLANPALSTAVLAQPDLLADGAPVEDLYAVFTPGRPVAVASYVASMRLTEESSEPHRMLPLAELDTIGWM